MTVSVLKRLSALVVALVVAACGTTYDVPDADEAARAEAARIFAEEAERARTNRVETQSTEAAQDRFDRVVARVLPAAERVCARETADLDGFQCELPTVVDRKWAVRNAYQTTNAAGEPYIAVTLPMLHDFRNEDEIAFVLGHEYGHHLARHLEKQKDQAVATAIIAGALVAGVNIVAAQGTSDYDAGIAIDTTLAAIMVGYALGQHAYSQSFELEADTIGAHIATEAGYDAVRGARFFARPEPETRSDGLLSFWGTHPPDDTRVATVIAQTRRSTRGEGLTRREIAP